MTLKLLPFQERGADLLAASKARLLVWDAGVGKTPTACVAATRANAKRVLVFCPPIAVSVWKNHFRDWTSLRPIVSIDSSNVSRSYAAMGGAGVRIIPYSRVRPNAQPLNAAARLGFDAIILDELHYLKNPRALRTQGVYGTKLDLVKTALDNARHIWGLSGTPVLNHAHEFWTHLHALRPDLIPYPQFGPMTYDMFVTRYCHTRVTPYGVKVVGSRNMPELAEKLRPFIDRLRLKDALPDLPDLRIVDHMLPPDTPIDSNLKAKLDKAVEDLGINAAALNDDELLEEVQAGSVAWSTARRLTGLAKAPGVALLADDILSDAPEEKLIVFAHHREVIEDLRKKLASYTPLVITGETSQKVRDQLIEKFQNWASYRLIILAIEAAGEVITLNKAHHVIVAEPSPVPAKNLQAIARAHRNGQKNAVLARFVLLPGTLDARLMAIVAQKTRAIAEIVDGVKPSVAEAFPETEEV